MLTVDGQVHLSAKARDQSVGETLRRLYVSRMPLARGPMLTIGPDVDLPPNKPLPPASAGSSPSTHATARLLRSGPLGH